MFTTRFYKLLAKKKEKKDAHNFLPSKTVLAYWLDAADVQRFLVLIQFPGILSEKSYAKMFFLLLLLE